MTRKARLTGSTGFTGNSGRTGKAGNTENEQPPLKNYTAMDETTTRNRKINPRLMNEGWDSVPGSQILYEQRAYEIAPGRIQKGVTKHPKKADYILEYHGKKLAVIEAKSDEKDVSEGVAQAKEYAHMLQIRFTYSTNGDDIRFIDMGVKDRQGNYIISSTEQEVDKFPTPQELWQMTYPEENSWRDKFNLEPLNRGFTIFQTMMTSPNEQKAEEKERRGKASAEGNMPYYTQYPRDFFDFIIIDECHRGGANDESEWRKLMEYFDYAYQLGMTATPRRK